jgi:hypothetical protein
VRKLLAGLLALNLAAAIVVAADRSDHEAPPQVPLASPQHEQYVIPASGRCRRLEHSKVRHPRMPRPATLLKPFHLELDTYRPAGAVQSAAVSAASIWHSYTATRGTERLAHYRIFLARVRDHSTATVTLSWVVLVRDAAGTFTGSIPTLGGLLGVPACFIDGNDVGVYSARTGKLEISAGGGDVHPNPFGPKYASHWRL